MSVNAPKQFDGTAEEAAVNYRSHEFNSEGRCWNCDCRSFGRVASYPCGASVPRVTETADPDYLERGFHVFAALQGSEET